MPRCTRSRYINDENDRIGPEFQAHIPEFLVPPASNTCEQFNEDTKMWAPNEHISDIKLNEFLLLANIEFGYNKEQAMGILYWHRFNMEKAIIDLRHFAPSQDVWTFEDVVRFNSAINKYGKDFLRIKQVIPHKPTASLVKHYYLCKHKIEENEVVDLQVLGRSRSSKPNIKV